MIEPEIIYNFNLTGEFARSRVFCLLTGKRTWLICRLATLRLLANLHNQVRPVKGLKPRDFDHPGDSSPPWLALV